MIHLQRIDVGKHTAPTSGFPFDIPIIQSLRGLAFTATVTFLVGENGSGKSTLLEAIACAVGSTTVGSSNVASDATLAHVRQFADHLKLTWTKKTRRGFFMRAEDFFGYTRKQAEIRADMERELRRVDVDYEGRSATAKRYAKMPYRGELADMQRRYGRDLGTYSHGESFLTLFQSRFVPNGLYLLDEPEAPLSPMRQLAFIALLDDAVKQGAQFIIATHSPIIMAFPNAQILHFSDATITPTAYNDIEHVAITRDFLNDPVHYLRHLLGGDG